MDGMYTLQLHWTCEHFSNPIALSGKLGAMPCGSQQFSW